MNERVIFEAATEIAGSDARQAFVDKSCASNPAMRERVLFLLATQEGRDSGPEAMATRSSNPGAFTTNRDSLKTKPSPSESATVPEESLAFLHPSTEAGSPGVLGHYEILKFVGQGAFGAVFKAFDKKLHRVVAIKVLSPEMAATSPPRKRFLREARSIAAVKHENVVQVYSVEEEPLPYLVMEFVEGMSLQQRIDQGGPLDLPEIVDLGRQIAAGLASAHSMNLIHRDIKPGNVLIETGGERKIKITDFGLARTIDDASMTQSGTIAGTPMYMAPEQATGARLDHRSDLFSFGSLLYVMTCGHPPFRAPNLVAVLRRVAEDSHRPIREIIPETPRWLVEIIDKLLSKSPDDRFQTASEVAEILARRQAELRSDAAASPVEGLGTLAVGSGADVERTTAPAIATPRVEARPRWLIPAAIIAPIIAGSILLTLPGRGRRNETRLSDPSRPGPAPAPASIGPAARPEESRPPKESTDPTTPRADEGDDRPLAEWLIARPGLTTGLTVSIADAAPRTVKAIADLPEGKIRLHGDIFLHEADDLTDEDLSRFGKLREVDGLAFESKSGAFPHVSDRGLRDFLDPTLPRRLSRIGFWSGGLTKVSEDGYLALNQRKSLAQLALGVPRGREGFLARLELPHLQYLWLIYCGGREGYRTTEGVMKGLASRNPHLNTVVLAGFPHLSVVDVKALGELDLLTSLNLQDCDLTDEGVESLGRLLKVESLELKGNPSITDRSLSTLRALTTLHTLVLMGSPGITDRGVSELSTLTRLGYLGLDDTSAGSAACKTLASLPSLKTLSLARTPVDDEGLEILSSLKSLGSLNLGGCRKVSDRGLGSLGGLASLTHLDLRNTPQVTEAGVRKLRAALPKCQIDSDHSLSSTSGAVGATFQRGEVKR